jgi:hypothetical protein
MSGQAFFGLGRECMVLPPAQARQFNAVPLNWATALAELAAGRFWVSIPFR